MLKFPAAERNKEVVLNVLKDHLPTDKAGLALEVASGSGTHVALFAQHFSKIIWHPSEIDQQCLQRFPIIFIFDICHSITLKQKPRYHFDLKFKWHLSIDVLQAKIYFFNNFERHLFKKKIHYQRRMITDCMPARYKISFFIIFIKWFQDQTSTNQTFSISAYKEHYRLQNVEEPFTLDVTTPVESWKDGNLQSGSLDAVVNMNMIHISPWDTAVVRFLPKCIVPVGEHNGERGRGWGI